MKSDAAQETGPEPAGQDAAWARYVQQLRTGPGASFDQQWNRYQEIYQGRDPDAPPPLVWQPAAEAIRKSNLGRFMRELGFVDYASLHAWSVQNRPDFWRKVLRLLGVALKREPAHVLDPAGCPEQPLWLSGARLNCMDSCFSADAEDPAIILGTESSPETRIVSYGELRELTDRVAAGLALHGLGRGDAVALYLPMTVDCVAAYLGIIKAGCSVVSVAESFAPVEVAKRLAIGRAAAVITSDCFLRAGKEIPLYAKAVEAAAPRAIVISASPGERAALRSGDIGWRDFLGSGEPGDSLAGDPEDIINILFSSGTTGVPKAIPWTHLTPIKCAMDGHFHQDIQPGDVVCWPSSVGWMMGPWLIFATMMNRATMALYEGSPTAKDFIRFVENAGVTVLGVVPSLVRAWRSSGVTGGADWSGIRVFSSTGEPSSREDYVWLMSLTGYRAPVIEYCGGTEIGGGYITGTVVQPASPATFTTPALGLDFAVLNGKGAPVAEGEAGEAFLVPPSIGLSQRLLNADHHEVYYGGCPKGPHGEILRRHGDHMARLPGGFYKALGRVDDTMNLGGIKVSSLELEQILEQHEDIYECAAVAARSGEEGAENLIIFAVSKGAADKERLTENLNRLIASKLNPLFRIHDLVLVDRLPRTASNKIMRRSLRHQYLEPPDSQNAASSPPL